MIFLLTWRGIMTIIFMVSPSRDGRVPLFLRLARRVGVGRRLIGEGADEHGRGGRAPRDRGQGKQLAGPP